MFASAPPESALSGSLTPSLPAARAGRINGIGMGMMLGLALLTGGCVMGEESYYYSPYSSSGGGYYYDPGYAGTVIYRQSPPARNYWYYERSRHDDRRSYWRNDHHRDEHGRSEGHRDGHRDRPGGWR